MDNLYNSWNRSCQYEKISPNSIVVPVLADGRPIPIPTKYTTECRRPGNCRNPTKTDKLYSLDADGGVCIDGLRSSSTAYESSDLQRDYYRATVSHFIGIVLCGRRRTGRRVLAPARAYVSAAVTTKLYRRTDRIRRNVYGRCVITLSADSALSVSTVSFTIP